MIQGVLGNAGAAAAQKEGCSIYFSVCRRNAAFKHQSGRLCIYEDLTGTDREVGLLLFDSVMDFDNITDRIYCSQYVR